VASVLSVVNANKNKKIVKTREIYLQNGDRCGKIFERWYLLTRMCWYIKIMLFSLQNPFNQQLSINFHQL